jgi:hypothetical protein
METLEHRMLTGLKINMADSMQGSVVSYIMPFGDVPELRRRRRDDYEVNMSKDSSPNLETSPRR